jgi:PAS domain S-box-containing protein
VALCAAGLALGAREVVSLENRERLLAVASRELHAYRLERALDKTLSSAREYREQLQTFLQGSADAICLVQEGIVVEANRAWLDLFGYSGDDALAGQPLMDLFEQETHAALKGALVACLQGKWSDHALKVQALLSDGSALPLEIVLTRVEQDGEPAIRLGVPARRNETSGFEAQLQWAVKNDASTGFLQLRHFAAALRERCLQPVRGGVREIALLAFDRFEELLKAIGALSGEDLLAQFADLLRAQLNPSDLCGRFGADALMVLLERGTPRDVEALPSSTPDVTAAATDALAAVRRAQERGGNQVVESRRSDTENRVQAYDTIWVKHIKAALMENRFRLVQQPIASLLGEDKGMFDVLVRMLDEQGAEVLPAEFIAAAERNELMKNIDRWVIGASMSFSANRKAECIFLRISKDTVLDKTLPAWLETQLRSIRVEPRRLCFQVSEDLANQYLRQTIELARTLGGLGFRFALEHFGAGRAPLKLLAEVDAHFIKIDGSLMQGLATNQLQQQRVKSLVDAAKRKHVETIAERVEDANTMAVLWQLGIEFIQGFFVNAPEDVTMSGDR